MTLKAFVFWSILCWLLAPAFAQVTGVTPAQLGVGSGQTPEPLYVLDSSRTWTKIGSIDLTSHTFSLAPGSVSALTTSDIPNIAGPPGCFATYGYSVQSDGGGALFCPDPAPGYSRVIPTITDGVVTAGSTLIYSGSSSDTSNPQAYWNGHDIGRPLTEMCGSSACATPTYIPAGTTIADTAWEPVGPPMIPLTTGTGTGYRHATFTANISGDSVNPSTMTVYAMRDGLLAAGQVVRGPGIPLYPSRVRPTLNTPPITIASQTFVGGQTIAGTISAAGVLTSANPGTNQTGAIAIGATVNGVGIPAGVTVASQLTGQTGWTGSYQLAGPYPTISTPQTITFSAPGGPWTVGAYQLAGMTVGASINTMTSGDLITLADGCEVPTVLRVRRTVPGSGAVLSATPVRYGQCLPGQKPADGANVAQASTSGAGTGGQFPLYWWRSPVYAVMSRAALADSSAPGAIPPGAVPKIAIGPLAQDDPGYVTDLNGVGYALARQPLDVRMFGAQIKPSGPPAGGSAPDSTAAWQTLFEVLSNTEWPTARIHDRFDVFGNLQAWPHNGASQLTIIGDNTNWSGIAFDGERPGPRLKISNPGGIYQNGDPQHANFGYRLDGLNFSGHGWGGALVQLGEEDNNDAINTPTLFFSAANSALDPNAISTMVNGLYTTLPAGSNLYTNSASRPSIVGRPGVFGVPSTVVGAPTANDVMTRNGDPVICSTGANAALNNPGAPSPVPPAGTGGPLPVDLSYIGTEVVGNLNTFYGLPNPIQPGSFVIDASPHLANPAWAPAGSKCMQLTLPVVADTPPTPLPSGLPSTNPNGYTYLQVSSTLACLWLQNANLSTFGFNCGGAPQAAIVMNSASTGNAQHNTFVGIQTQGQGIEGVRLSDTSVRHNVFLGGLFSDSYGINAVAGYTNLFINPVMQSPAIGEVLYMPGHQQGVTSIYPDMTNTMNMDNGGGLNLGGGVTASGGVTGSYFQTNAQQSPGATSQGNAAVFGSANSGLQLRGNGSQYDMILQNSVGNGVLYLMHSASTAGNGLVLGGNPSNFNWLGFQSVAPLIASGTPTLTGFGSGPTITGGGPAAFQINVGSGGTASSGTISMLGNALRGWNCNFVVINHSDTNLTRESGDSANSVTLTNYDPTGVVKAWPAGSLIRGSCLGY